MREIRMPGSAREPPGPRRPFLDGRSTRMRALILFIVLGANALATDFSTFRGVDYEAWANRENFRNRSADIVPEFSDREGRVTRTVIPPPHGSRPRPNRFPSSPECSQRPRRTAFRNSAGEVPHTCLKAMKKLLTLG